ncbi:hypothetical protein C0580_04900 [Candidatus Parcubacteria bacterium]|nr:MAG: hypothetical protein C0580_04900 [Candidatus Parcubacteria bacterium]
MNDLELYFNRVMPVIGRQLEGKRIAFFNLELTHLIADAFARCGVRDMLFIDSAKTVDQGPFVLSYGRQYANRNIGQAIAQQIINHNQLIADWRHEQVEKLEAEQAKSLDLIVAAGNIADYHELARFDVPMVFFLMLSGVPVNSLVLVKHPELPDPSSALDSIRSENVLTSTDIGYRLTWLDASDLAMNFAKALLLRGSPYERHDLEDLMFGQGRNLVLRGQAKWPWWIHYVNPELKLDYIQRVMEQRYFVPQPPINILQDKRVMVIGCGTASLMIGELINFCRSLFLVDPKSFSAFNPVRQLLGTDAVGQAKPKALIKHLTDKIGNKAGEFQTSDLKVSDRDPHSLEQFEATLDSWQPDLVVVATGRTYDDNYAICELLRRRGIKHVVPTAFPGATHYKNIVVDGHEGPCYECIRGNTSLDYADGVDLNAEAREMFYTDVDDPTQPATIFETWPSSHSLLRLSMELLLDPTLRSEWFTSCLAEERTCFVGANLTQKTDGGAYAYGVTCPGQMVVYGMDELIRVDQDSYTCPTCRRSYSVRHKINTEGS